MFKKAAEAKLHQRLSGADRKKLKRTVKGRFPGASDADIDVLLPPKVELSVAKFQNRVHIYSLEGGFPMFFDVDGRGTEVFPTVFALWMVPELLPAFVLKGGEVSRFVIGGADLMFPGIHVPAEGLPSFLSGEPWAVKVPGNPSPIAVGVTTMSSTEALKAGLRGKALRILHYYRDSLWESVEGHYVPNAGFLEDVVYGDPALASSSQTDNSCEGTDEASNNEQNDINNKEVGGSVNETTSDVLDELGTPLTAQADSSTDKIVSGMSDLNVVNDIPPEESNVQHTLSTEDVDMLLDKCLLQALHTTVKDKDFPLPGSTLWSNHVLPCRPPGMTLDIKKSSYKKLSKWLQAKSSTGLITVKEDKHKKETVLYSVNRKHPDYTSFKPEKPQVEKIDQIDNHAPKESSSNKMLEVTEIYKPSVHVNPIFVAVGADTSKLYTAAEASDIVFKYVEKEKLDKPTEKFKVVLDAILCDALFKGAIKKGTTYPTEIHKKDIGSTFISRMQPHHVVTRGSESVVRKGALKTIQIMTERRQGNKKVTRLSGLETFLLDAEALASELQKKCACSTTVAELPGKKGYEVLVQGGVIDDLARHLVEQYGIPKKYIEVLDKTRK
ncbi:eukaryotic translation initiation factor 2D [Cucurbita pepo subsp. pepo]|uniref:eukaryotic translation initiation factor 2D n=1 Tax=Cucurbita pepo subsp. pepo TaxID=3664 RepID=UPI000C9D9B4B|nr:eukaryotic translation initiation factor 2D [Cucurbita pepo subsp. pepo]XP_023550340.1 eukaryotic translation initiation factor 2D [Cucurbita pepo subsp. pepo]